MKQRWRHLIASALALALCLSAAACGKSDDTAGDDWRASGAVVDSGTITHDGDSVDVLVTVSESSAAFYRDMPEQVLFDSVSFPVSIPDAEEAFHAISFDDIDGDGESDVLVRFLHKSGDTTEMIWIWDPVERYVFREDLSTVAVGGALSSQPYFTRNGLQINAAVEMGTFLLEDGVCSYSGLGDGYNTDDCYWEIVKNGDYTHDGIRELHFDTICYIPEGAIPYFDQQYITVTSSELYDYYTGTWLTASTAYGNSQRGENYYLYTISWQGSSYLITPEMRIDKPFMKALYLLDGEWETCSVENFHEGEHGGVHFSAANVRLDHVYQRGTPHEGFETCSSMVFRGLVLRCAARVSAASPVLAAARTVDSPRGILTGHAAFDRSFCVAADSEQDAVRLLTPQTIGFLTAFDRCVEGQLLSLCWRENTFSLALETDYAFAAVAGSVDLRDLDAVRRSYVRSLQEMCCVLDQLKASPALTGAAE